jgi:hypothetical protein
MFGARFYNQTTRRYVAMFGTLFNDIVITRQDNSGNTVQRMKVPINYGPYQKFLARITQDPNLNSPAITLPRISFEIVGMSYDGERKLTRTLRNSVPIESDNGVFSSTLVPTPYNLEFQLTIMTKYTEDGTKILEQILPYFQPDWTPSVKLVDELDYYLDVPIILNSVSTEDVYEGAFDERRALTWTLNFTMKGWFFGPTSNRKVIKFATTNLYAAFDQANSDITITVQPGLTANGEPTTDINETIPYAQINEDDDWGFIVQIEDNT